MRPWRLTRRARVEMEAALRSAQRNVHVGLDALGVRGERGLCFRDAAEDVIEADLVALGLSERDAWPRARRILRARVALALRAALRADEDARCEEAHFAAHTLATEEHEPLRRFARSRVWGALDAIDALREWPQAALSPKGTIPRALWEVAR